MRVLVWASGCVCVCVCVCACVCVFLSGGTPHIQILSGHVTAQLPVSLPVLHGPEKTQ